MAYPNGSIPLTSNIGTTASTDIFPTHLDSLGQGGLMTMLTVADMNLITTARRKFGMQVAVTSDSTPANNKVYILANIAMGGVSDVVSNNSNWIEYSSYNGASPFEYGTNDAIKPVLGSNTASGCLATIGGGGCNSASAPRSVIDGGQYNIASGCDSTVGGGQCNTSGGLKSVIGGGIQNTASGCCSFIGGGCLNLSSNCFSTVSGGLCNTASANYSSVGAGWCNKNNARHSVISGGQRNVIQSPTDECCSLGVTIGGGIGHNTSGGTFNTTTGNLTGVITCCDAGKLSTIGGGLLNCGTGGCSTIGGGLCNTVSGIYSVINGGCNNTASVCGSVIGGGCSNTSSNYFSVVSGGRINIASGGDSVIGGGLQNCATGNCSTVGGGNCNVASNTRSTIAGGLRNISSANSSTVGGGAINTASGQFSTVGGGCENCLSGDRAVISGGANNTNVSDRSVIGGGYKNNISSTISAILGGSCNFISSSFSVIGGGCCNTVSGTQSAILGGVYNRTCGFAGAMIVGTNLCATQANTTFANCLSVDNLTVGCAVSVGANKVLVNATPKIGSFFSNVTQSATTINTPKVMTLSNTDAFSSGVSIVSASQITVDTTGIYNLQFSAQIDRVTTSGVDIIDIWLRKQGVDEPNTNTKVTVSGSANQAKVVASWNFYVSLTAGQYVELTYSVTDLQVKIVADVENLVVPHPATPSLIVTMSKIS